jgi:CRISPR/Cas system-associated endonuclease/helicase Cas3
VVEILPEERVGECVLLHSRFRAVEREQLMGTVTDNPEDLIAVSTQVIEAGIDLNASVLITEAAPWPSIVQRAGGVLRSSSMTRKETERHPSRERTV